MSETKQHQFGRYIRGQRAETGMSLRTVAKRLDVSAVYLGEVERGVRPPLKRDHWDKLISIIPSINLATLEKLTAKAKPIQLDLRDAPPNYQDLGLALARRIDKKNISKIDFEKLFSILGDDDE